eukprot:815690-Heterocapsa_arctica.AAC.1
MGATGSSNETPLRCETMARHSCGGLECQSKFRFHVRSWLGHFLRTDVTMDKLSCGGQNCQ